MPEERSPSKKQRGDRSPTVATPAYGDLAADAAAHLARGGYTVEGLGRNPSAIDQQAACLVQWARQRNLILTDTCTAGLKRHLGTTAEHEVFYRACDNRAVKRTYPGTFGVTPDPKGEQRAATPLFYLLRLGLMNGVFGSDLRLEGIVFGKPLLLGAEGEQPSIVISQPWIRAADISHPHPTEAEIAEFMESLDFRRVPNLYYGWRRAEDRLLVIDARPDNFIKSSQGVLPIDLVISTS